MLNKAHLMPMNFGLSPGAVLEEYWWSELTCVMERMVAPTTHGSPSRECKKINQPMIKISKWYPGCF